MRLVYRLAACCLLVVLSACAELDYRQGTQFSDDAFNALTVGTTTKASVLAQYGPPPQTIPDGTNTLFVYRYTVIGGLPFVSPNRSETVSLTFDGKGVLKDKNKRKDDTTAGNPITN